MPVPAHSTQEPDNQPNDSAHRNALLSERGSDAGLTGGLWIRHLDGQSIQGVRWEIADSTGHLLELEKDGEQLFQVPIGDWELSRCDANFLPLERNFRIEAGDTRTVWVVEGRSLEVTVIDSRSFRPVAGVSLRWARSDRTGFTDSEGNYTFSRAAPDAWGRLLVSHQDYLPTQLMVPSARIRDEHIDVRITPCSRAKNLAIDLVTPDGAPLEGVKVFGEYFSQEWTNSEPIQLGVSDPQGHLPLGDWCADLRFLQFEGTAFPSRVDLSEQPLPSSGSRSLTVYKAVTGWLEFPDAHSPSHQSVRILASFDDSTLTAPHPIEFEADFDPRVPATLPARKDTLVTALTSEGLKGSSFLRVEHSDWTRRIPLQPIEGQPIRILSNRRIESVTVNVGEIDRTLSGKEIERIPGGIALTLPQGCANVSVRTSTGLGAHVSRHVRSSCRDSIPSEMHLSFPERRPIELHLVGPNGQPIPRAAVVLTGRDLIPGTDRPRDIRVAATPDGCWLYYVRNQFFGFTDESGVLQVMVPDGRYEIRLPPPPHAEASVFHWFPLEGSRYIQVSAARTRFDLTAHRPRRLSIRISEERDDLWRWSLFDPIKMEGNTFGGEEAELWITDDSYLFQLRNATGTMFASFEVPAGVEDWVQVIQ